MRTRAVGQENNADLGTETLLAQNRAAATQHFIVRVWCYDPGIVCESGFTGLPSKALQRHKHCSECSA
jgi:hypothetical protein